MNIRELITVTASSTARSAQSIVLDYDNHIVEDRVGKDLASTSYSWKTLKDNGLWVSNGSDAPVELPDALRGMECAVTRTSIDGTGPYLENQAFSVKEAIDSFTSASAHASFEEDIKGKIAAGYLADFVVLKEDPFSVDPRHIHDISIAVSTKNNLTAKERDVHSSLSFCDLGKYRIILHKVIRSDDLLNNVVLFGSYLFRKSQEDTSSFLKYDDSLLSPFPFLTFLSLFPHIC